MLTAMELAVGLPRKGGTHKRSCDSLPRDAALAIEGIRHGDTIIPAPAKAMFFKSFRLVISVILKSPSHAKFLNRNKKVSMASKNLEYQIY
jgi:hypothetical protein